MKKVVTFGEMLLRLSTERHLRFSQAGAFKSTYAGGEFNVSVSLANYGVPTEFITRLPDNDIGQCALMEMRKCNVGSENVILGGERLGMGMSPLDEPNKSTQLRSTRQLKRKDARPPGCETFRSIPRPGARFH